MSRWRHDPPFLALAAAFTVAAFPALSQTACAQRDVVVGMLERVGEHRARSLLRGDDTIFEVWIGDASWTITMTTVDGSTCIMAAGELWADVEPVKGQAL